MLSNGVSENCDVVGLLPHADSHPTLPHQIETSDLKNYCRSGQTVCTSAQLQTVCTSAQLQTVCTSAQLQNDFTILAPVWAQKLILAKAVETGVRGLNVSSTARSFQKKQVAERSKEGGEGGGLSLACSKGLYHHSHGEISGNHGKLKSGWPGLDWNPGSAQRKSQWFPTAPPYSIPFIKKAQEVSPSKVKLFSAPWSAPDWMKNINTTTNASSLKKEYYQVFADYYIKFLDAYAAEGLTFWGLTPQNEPGQGLTYGKFNSMGWTPNQMLEFLLNNFCPSLKSHGYEDLKLMINDNQRSDVSEWLETWTALNNEVLRADEGEMRREWSSADIQGMGETEHPRENMLTSGIVQHDSQLGKSGRAHLREVGQQEFQQKLYKNETLREYASGMAVHWYTDQRTAASILTKAHEQYPDKFLLYTEACVKKNHNPTAVELGKWHKGVRYMSDIIEAMVRLLAFHHGELSSVPSGITPRFSHVGIVPDDAAGRFVSSGISHSPTLAFRCCSILTSLHPHRAAVAERLARSPPTKANRAQCPAGSSDSRKWESCRTIPLVGGSSRGSPVSPTPSFRRLSIFTSIALKGS
ncbi:hypothetical protein PR048_030607 [Dryococelus australis]|uniref:Glucosylceramidase n=1 Tax=Dryococelus australis TaxID=614101 RepID=A0ABQ9GC39_9NEOP|nr:hypothetical protein PR048_030607 [Dryococelus australis]